MNDDSAAAGPLGSGSLRPLPPSGYSRPARLALLALLPLLLGLAHALTTSSVTGLTFALACYYTSALLASSLVGPKRGLGLCALLALVLALPRLAPTREIPERRGLTLLGVLDVAAGEAFEQDFLLPVAQPRYRELLERGRAEAVLRIVGTLPATTRLVLNGHFAGTVGSRRRVGPMPFQTLTDYYLTLPAEELMQPRLTVRLELAEAGQIGYGSGVRPFPPRPHARLIRAGAPPEDLSARFPLGRFRAQSEVLLVSREHRTPQGEPLIMGVLL